MDYSNIISQAWQFTWRNKYLWILGFFGALNFGGANIGNSLTQGGTWLFQNIDTILTGQSLVSLLIGGISIVLWLIGTNARIGLISEVAALDAHSQAADIRKILGDSTNFFVRIILMQLIIWLPITALNIVGVFLSAPITESFYTSFEAGQPPDFGLFGLVWLLGCSVSLLTIPLSFLDAISYRSVVIENNGIAGGIKRGFQLIRTNIGALLILSIIMSVLGFIFSAVMMLIMSPLMFWVLGSMMQLSQQCSTSIDMKAMMACMSQVNTDLSVMGPFSVVSVVFAALSSVMVVFQSAVFTLAYTRFEGVETKTLA